MHEAIALLERSLSLSPVDALSLMELARMQMVLDDTLGALDTAQRVVSLYPEQGCCTAVLGAALLRAGRRDEACAVLEQAVQACWTDNPQGRITTRRMLHAACGTSGVGSGSESPGEVTVTPDSL